ncbi:hypothetical protein BS47DRAFT_1369546 [Hydnum rufescens UP504]|uniref:Uncharacterized protein n=1 Tax=Hydnum rufescens UP504 TaxID=1448309 RepID=A0A9P6ACJ2_9AGAM|nr:hypothetical protein BS47DRAFT_1369546 [Hydnum rufescens UP504]
MVPASWVKGTSRWDWLNGHGPAFLNACKNGSKFQWLNILYCDWFEVYHVSLPVDVEPVPGAVYPEPVGKAAIKEMEAMVTLRKKAAMNPDVNTGGLFPPMFPETLALSGGSVTPSLISSTPKPRHKQIEHVYSLLYYNSRVKDAVEAQHLIDNEENPLSPQETRSQGIVTQQRLTKEHWLVELLEIQAIIVEKRKSDYKQVVTEWELRNKDIQEPYKQQLAFDNMMPYLETFLHTFQERTGLCMMIIVGGPTLNSHGNMVVTCMHQGVTPGPHPTNFNTFAGSLFQDQITPKFIEFLKKKYGLPPDPVTLSPSVHGASTAEGSLMKQGMSNEDGNSENHDNDGNVCDVTPYTLSILDSNVTSNSLGEEACTDADSNQDLDGETPEITLSLSAFTDNVDAKNRNTPQQPSKKDMPNPIDHSTMNDNNGSQSGSNKRRRHRHSQSSASSLTSSPLPDDSLFIPTRFQQKVEASSHPKLCFILNIINISQ